MKTIFCVLAILVCSFCSIGQVIGLDMHENQVILNLEGISDPEIAILLAEFEAEELWLSPLTKTRCWNFSSFPDVHEIELDGEIVFLYNIIDAAEKIKNRISGGTSGVSVSINPKPTYEAPFLANTLSPSLDPSLFIERGDNSVLLGVLDSGHTKEVDDNNGYPYNVNYISTKNYIPYGPNQDESSHGTHVLGIANHIATFASSQQNGIDVDVRKILDLNNQGTLGAYILAVEEAIVDGVQILNLSLSYPEVEDNYFVNLIIKAIEDNNVLAVVAAGNDGLNLSNGNVVLMQSNKNIFPAALQSTHMITVASLNTVGKIGLSEFSNYGVFNVDIAAPGENISGYNIESDFVRMSGTSQATAIVSGVACSLASHQSEFDAKAIKCAILTGSTPMNVLHGKIVSGGVVNAVGALAALDMLDCDDDVDTSPLITNVTMVMDVAPNPFLHSFDIGLQKGTNVVMISDMLGRTVASLSFDILENEAVHNIDALKDELQGLYIISIWNQSTNERRTATILKE